MRHTEATKSEAEFLYIVKHKQPVEISKITGVPLSTVQDWIRKNGWDKYGRIRLVTPWKVANDIMAHIELINKKARDENRTLDNGEVDRIIKLVKASKQIYKPAEYASTAIDVVDRLSTFIKNRDADLYNRVTDLLLEFVQELTDKMKGA